MRDIYMTSNESSPSPTHRHGGFDQQTNDWRKNKVIESKLPFRNSPDMRAAGVTKSPVLSSKSQSSSPSPNPNKQNNNGGEQHLRNFKSQNDFS